MNLLKYTYSEVLALVRDGMTNVEAIRHWEICKALMEGKTNERVAEDFKMSVKSIEYVRSHKCRCTP